MKITKGLYVITAHNSAENIITSVAKAIAGGAIMVQYRHKNISEQQQLFEAQDLQILCKHLKIPLIINDNILLAKRIGADGVHLGRNDDDIKTARIVLGEQAIIGVSCYNKLSCALTAEQSGADYVAFGRFFESKTKPDAIHTDLEILIKAKRKLSIPIVAIGGINQTNCAQVVKAGADMVAVIDGVFGSDDIQNSAQLISDRIEFFKTNI